MKVPRCFSSYVGKENKQKSRSYIQAPFYCVQSYFTVSECLGHGDCHFLPWGPLISYFFLLLPTTPPKPTRYFCNLIVTTASIGWGSRQIVFRKCDFQSLVPKQSQGLEPLSTCVWPRPQGKRKGPLGKPESGKQPWIECTLILLTVDRHSRWLLKALAFHCFV